ncbi:MAG: aminotransferase class I/II-fold pyridoxal phosphate-dependent enzyme [Vibrio sp.]|uniref:aminotransferase class I/II-fold pyridoxal phosphate-dependent enzyme n=1 Tax=Vibrio TaxID=662 RepID=UPI001EBF015A|nr:aminotransferase class I/II-fold pyridoxal phosphate-dependent enzyme [Vibrio sp.]NRB67656.1 aminotransferase class I/II-fold pyridoxal phosphate-dependent enzyme [Vibrio sp.]
MNKYTNIKKSIDISEGFWDTTSNNGLANIISKNMGNGEHLTVPGGEQFVNMSSYSYLGLDSHPAIIQGAIDGIQSTGALNSSTSRIRVQYEILNQAECQLGELTSSDVFTLPSCAAAAAAVLPLLSSGALTNNTPPVMVFDKHAHFCLNYMKPICADETKVITIEHNDMCALEDICKQHQKVAFVADSIYSTGGAAPIKRLLELQSQYGLFLLIDEAHGLSTTGHNGVGMVLSEVDELNDQTLLIASLNKGFGASGGAVFFRQHKDNKVRNLLARYGGPITWSQRINTAGLGAIIASTELHQDGTINRLQTTLMRKVELFDELVTTRAKGDGLPIRFVSLGDEQATINIARELFSSGFYTSAIFFPVIARGKAGLRIMLRSNMQDKDIQEFAIRLNQLKQKHGVHDA